jgi:hypothetical protein
MRKKAAGGCEETLNTLSAWNIGLSAWVIQDGNYPDFGVGETVEFAVEFHQQPGTAVEASNSDVSATHVRDVAYRVLAEKISQPSEITVLNIGILVYSQFASQLSDVERGAQFRADLELCLDPYHYFEYLGTTGGALPLVYSWRINSILRQTAPFIEAGADSGRLGGRKLLVRDASKLGYEEIQRTDAWSDDHGSGEYILVCDLLPIPAKRVSSTAIH